MFVTIEIWRETEEELKIFSNEEIGAVPDLETTSISKVGLDHTLLTWLTLFLLRLQCKHYIPDYALECLLKFLYTLFVIIGRSSEVAKNIAEQLPRSMYSLRKYVGVANNFEKFVVCCKCNSIYNMKDCFERPGVSKFQEFSSKSPCNTLLLKTVEVASKKKILYPFKIYCYQSIKDSLQKLFNQPNFDKHCEHWRTRSSIEGTISDIYDGQIWKDFQTVCDKPFLSSLNLAFCLKH